MLARMVMQLKCEEPNSFSIKKSSLMQGVLMEQLESGYAQKLHLGGWNPYSQFAEKREEQWYWIVNTLNQEAYEKILQPLQAQEFSRIYLEHGKQEIEIVEKKIQSLPIEKLMSEFYSKDMPRYLDICFKTPTAFKRQGKYLFYPELHCIYQNLMRKYSAVQNVGMNHEDTLEQLTENSQVIHYRLNSCYFYMEGIKVPAFMGRIRLKLTGPQTLVNFAYLLFRFGYYSGIGIKTSIGMGAFKILGEEFG